MNKIITSVMFIILAIFHSSLDAEEISKTKKQIFVGEIVATPKIASNYTGFGYKYKIEEFAKRNTNDVFAIGFEPRWLTPIKVIEIKEGHQVLAKNEIINFVVHSPTRAFGLGKNPEGKTVLLELKVENVNNGYVTLDLKRKFL
jgi:hypothetical protein